MPNSRGPRLTALELLTNHDWSFGGKTITTLGSYCLMINNAFGAGVTTIPLIFLHSGAIVPTLVLTLIATLGVLCSTMMCEAMRYVPGNEHFLGRVEYLKLAEFFLGVRWSWFATFFLVPALMVANIGSIIVSAQVLDQLLIRVHGETCGLEVSSFSWVCSGEVIGNSPFQTAVITKGFLFCLVMAIPLGILNLEDNMIVQIIATIICFFCVADWMWVFYPKAEIANYASEHMWGTTYTSLLGPAISNFSFVMTVPSWCNEKEPSVNVNWTMWGSISICVVTYVVFGIVAAARFKDRLTESVDFLSLIQNSKHAGVIDVLTCQLFPLMAGLLGVPITSIICRYNLLQSGIVKGKVNSNLVAVVLPWLISFPCQTLGNGEALPILLNWGSLIFGSVCNFIIPVIIYTAYQRRTTRTTTRSLTTGLLHDQVLDILNTTLEMGTEEHWALPGPSRAHWKYHFGCALTIFITALLTYTIYTDLISA